MIEWFEYLLDELSSSDPKPQASAAYRRHLEEQRAADRAILAATLRSIVLGVHQGPNAEELCRSIGERSEWHVPVDESGAPLVREERAGRYRLAIGEKPGDNKKGGLGGRLLRLYSTPPEGPSRALSGREALRSLPEGLDGILLCDPPDAFVELRSEHLKDLPALLDALDLEEALFDPGPGQVDRLLRATWWVSCSEDGKLRPVREFAEEELAVEAFTHPDRIVGERKGFRPMKGERLFRLITEAADCDGIVVNRHFTMGWGDLRIRGIGFGPAMIHGFLRGEDLRPGAAPLPAQTKDEVRLWLRTRRFPGDGSRLIEAPLPSGTLIRAYRKQGSGWRMQETLLEQFETSVTWSPVFELGDPEATGYGPKPSRIVCPGLLAVELGARSFHNGENPERLWSPGRWLVAGYLTDELDRKCSAERLEMARELEKLLPEGAAEIPWSACLTVRGASVFRLNPAARTRDWIERTVRRAEQFTKPWVFGR